MDALNAKNKELEAKNSSLPSEYAEHMLAHRVKRPLKWIPSRGQSGPDGEVVCVQGEPFSLVGQSIYLDTNTQVRGVSFFVPQSHEHCNISHAMLKKPLFGCTIIPTNVQLPSNFRFCFDRPLNFRMKDGVDDRGRDIYKKVLGGQHWTMFAAEDCLITDFERDFQELISSSGQLCDPVRGGGYLVDNDFIPSDRLTHISVMALDDLVSNEDTNDNTRMFASLYAMHLRAENLSFEEVLKFTPAASMIAVALDVWVVRDPYLTDDTMEAMEILSTIFDFVEPKLNYEPFWVRDN